MARFAPLRIGFPPVQPPRRWSATLVPPTLVAAALFLNVASAQDPSAAEPIVGLRENPPRITALAGARVVTAPGNVIESATIILDGRSIVAVGPDVALPAGARVIDCDGKSIYAGLIDAYSEVDVEFAESDREAGHWNRYVMPQRSARSAASGFPPDIGKLRSQGVTVRLAAPRRGIIKGTSCALLLGGSEGGQRLLRDDVFQHLQLTVPRRGPRSRYPNSPMGAVALVRQTLLDSDWYRDAWDAHRNRPGVPRPEPNGALDVLAEAMSGGTFVIDAPNERMAIRGAGIAGEFSLAAILRGSGREYRRLDQIAATDLPVLVPVDFDEPPEVTSPDSAADVSLRELLHWRLAPENPARLHAAGVRFCLTTDGLDDPDQFLERVRTAVERGLSKQAALAALTTTPAELLGIDDLVGRVRVGGLANLMITDGDLFDAGTDVLETWVAGERFEIKPPKDIGVDELLGRWRLGCRIGGKKVAFHLDFTRRGDQLAGAVSPGESESGEPDGQDDAAESGGDEEVPEETGDDAGATGGGAAATGRGVKLETLIRSRDRLTATVALREVDERFAEGTWRLSVVTVAENEARPDALANLVGPAGTPHRGALKYVGEIPEPADKSAADVDEKPGDPPEPIEESGADEQQAEREQPRDEARESGEGVEIAVNYPLGAHGLTEPPGQPETVLFRGATLWTCGDAGTLEKTDLLVRRGKIAEIGRAIQPPDGCLVVDVRGRHLTPGIIDCHSHMATDGGINESGQAVTAEVRIGDFLDNSDINIYRQLAGGVTTINILHGSANPIGGQNAVVKLRWGASMDGMRLKGAPAGIKFALGENVKRNTSRYPNTRMGVEQIIRDQFLAAREYEARHRRWREGFRDGLPPRRDLQLEALAEVQRGERWIHCHSYRQDEIVATLDVLEEFGVRIGTLQHILEGYKVADRMARHGAMASAFSDWWAYKFEVYDAIPYNGVLMHEAGVVVSYNSDDRELARHLNTEAAKAVKYGGVPPQEALKFVTLNPAKQLRIDDRVGSLEVGKDADLAVWSGRPLSTTSRCEQTWIDGRRYFDLETDRRLRRRDGRLHHRLVQMILSGGSESGDDGGRDEGADEVDEENRWVRYDVYCNALGGEARNEAEAR